MVEDRRIQIVNMLKHSDKPISGSDIAKKFNVSRQIIVQDIALLRAQSYDIMATARGYMFYPTKNNYPKRVISIQHKGEDIRKELEIIIDNGGRLLDVIVEHKVYGQIRADLMLETRKDINDFLDKMEKECSLPLMILTNGSHYHTIEAKDEDTLDLIEEEIKKALL